MCFDVLINLYTAPFYSSLNLTSPTIPHECKIVAVVCTKPSDVEIRSTIRQTWANPLFSNAIRNKFINVFFLVGDGYDGNVVEDEVQKFSDILQVAVYDNYTNLVYKLLAAYRWIELYHPDKFVLKIDSDVVVLLDKIANRLGSKAERTIQCYVLRNSLPVRNITSPWYIPESVYPKYYLPDYCSGPTYLISPAALSAILKASQDAKVFEVEDAFFTGLLSKKALVKLHHERGIWLRSGTMLPLHHRRPRFAFAQFAKAHAAFYQQSPVNGYDLKSSQPCVNGEGTVISFPVHHVSPTTLVESWQHLSHLRCRWPIEHFLLSIILKD